MFCSETSCVSVPCHSVSNRMGEAIGVHSPNEPRSEVLRSRKRKGLPVSITSTLSGRGTCRAFRLASLCVTTGWRDRLPKASRQRLRPPVGQCESAPELKTLRVSSVSTQRLDGHARSGTAAKCGSYARPRSCSRSLPPLAGNTFAASPFYPSDNGMQDATGARPASLRRRSAIPLALK